MGSELGLAAHGQDMTITADWKTQVYAAIQVAAGPPAGQINDLDEDRQAGEGRSCRECGDVGPAILISPGSESDDRGRWTYHQAVYIGTLSDLLDAIADGSLRLEWVRRTL
ncbi:hypothetical protein [Nocardioides sp. InS609-2]|uniref:hypothetical protein n=1 Tax=Nocardioides sp. InS609-2 TaxID=2760705 RepID=UPI0020C0EC44|nr:hypothetical protein [Nocardioides sp. InS609-2]